MDGSKPSVRPQLLVIDGIGEKVADRLADRGITTFAQLADATDEQLAGLLAGLRGGFTAQRIAAGRWREQARGMIPSARAGRSGRLPVEHPTGPPTRHNFTVEVAVDVVDGAVVTAQVDHVQSGDRRSWVGWDPDGLVAFLTERITGKVPPVEASEPDAVGETRRSAPVSDTRAPASAPALHAYAVVPEAPERCGRGEIRAQITFQPAALALDPTSASSARVRVFLRGRPGQKSSLVGATETAIEPRREVQLVVPCTIPRETIDPRVFALVEVRSDATPTAPVGSIPGAHLAVLAPG